MIPLNGNSYQLVILVVMVGNLGLKISLFQDLHWRIVLPVENLFQDLHKNITGEISVENSSQDLHWNIRSCSGEISVENLFQDYQNKFFNRFFYH